MRVDTVGMDLCVFVVDTSAQNRVEYKYWISVGDFFHLLLSDSTSMVTYSGLCGDAAATTTPDIGPTTKMIPMVGLKIMEEISQEGKSAGAVRILEMSRLHQGSHQRL